MIKLKNRAIFKIIIFALIISFTLWLSPVNSIAGDTGDGTTVETTAAAETTTETIAEVTTETGAETTAAETVTETTEDITTETTVEDTEGSTEITDETADSTDETTETTAESVTTPNTEKYSASLNVASNPDVAVPGENLTFKVIVKNTGNMPLYDINVTNTIPELTLLEDAEGADFDSATGAVSFVIDKLEPGEIYEKEINVSVVIVVLDTLVLQNAAKISADKIEDVEFSLDVTIEKQQEVVVEDSTVTEDTTQTTETTEITEETTEDTTEETTETTEITEETTTEETTETTEITEETTVDETANTLDVAAITYAPFIYSDKDDYQPGETVTIFGEGFVPGEVIQIIFYAINDETGEQSVENISRIENTKDDGTFIFTYTILGADRYRVEARSIVEDSEGDTKVLNADSIELETEATAVEETIVEGTLLSWTEFKDCHHKIILKKTGLEGTGLTATFNLYKNGSYVGSRTVSASNNYTVEWDSQPEGRYTVTETNGPEGYTLSVSPSYIDITQSNWDTKPDSYFTFTAVNTRCGGDITLNKTGLDAGVTAGFTLYDSDNHAVGSEKTVTGNGSVSWTGLDWDTYKIKETTTPAGYAPIADITNIIVNSSLKSYTFDRVNTKNPGSITLNKTGLGSTDTAGFTLYNSSNNPVGAQKTVTGNGSVSWTGLAWDTYKIAETLTPAGYMPIADITGIVVGATQQTFSFDRVNSKISGSIKFTKIGLAEGVKAKFTLYNSAGTSFGEKELTGLATGSPYVTWTDVPYGSGYYIRETFTPAGYNTMADITGINITTNGQVVSVSGENLRCHGSVKFTKIGLGAGVTAKFTLYNSAGTSLGEKEITGVASGPNPYVTWTDVPYGSGYYIRETFTPAGYNTMADITGISITTQGQVYEVSGENIKKLGSITLNKTGLDAGVTAGFTLYDSTGAAVGIEKTVTGNGSVSWTNLPWGTYKIVETTVPSGYSAIADITGIVVGAAQQSYSYTKANTKIPGSVTLTKTGLDAGVTAGFTLYDSSNNPVGSQKTVTGNGSVSWGSLAWGTYSIKETLTPAGYASIADITGIVIGAAQQTFTFTRANTKIPGDITLNKSGLDSTDVAGFTLYDSSNNPVGVEQVITGNDSVNWTGLAWGTYKIVETTPPAGYAAMSDVTAVVGATEQTYVFDRVNSKIPGTVNLIKNGLDSTDVAGFTLYDSTGAAVGAEKTITGNDTITWTGLAWGTYKIVETTPPAGYAAIADITDIIIGATQQTYTFERTNEKTPGEIVLNKTGLDSTDVAGFTLYNSAGNKVGDEQFVTGNGSVSWTGLVWDTYKIVESTTPAGYTSITDITAIVINATHKIYTFERENTKIPGTITLNKTGLDAGVTAGFTLYDSSNNPVGVEKTVTGNGSVSWTGLAWGTYKIVETTTPAGYTSLADITGIVVDAEEQSFSFTRVNTKIPGSISLTKTGLGSTDTAGFTLYDLSNNPVGAEKTVTGNGSVSWTNLAWGTYTIKETAVPAGYTAIADITDIVVGSAQQTFTFTRANTRIPGDITLNKTGLDAGVTAGFTLYDSTNTAVGTEKTVTGNGSVSWSDLPWGTYKIVETTVPSGYSAIADITGIIVGSAQQSYSYTRTNTKIPGEITLNKTGLGAADTAGFTLYDSAGSAVGSQKTVTGNGSVKWTGLAWGTYTIKETTTPSGYTPMSDITDIVVGATTQTYVFDRVNSKIPGNIILVKSGLDATDVAGFTLYDSTGAAVGAEKTVTGNGSVSWTDLPWGTYKIVETTPPAGYVPIADITDIVVGAAQQSYTFDRENTKEPGDITLNKSGLGEADTAGFTLYDSSNNPVGDEQFITGNGSVSWAGLAWDTYKIVETTVPVGYAPMADITVIVVGAVQKSYTFDRENTTQPGDITLNKSGLTEADTAGFTLYDSTGAAVGAEKTVTGNGSVSWAGLAWDTYSIVETTVPDGYTAMADITGIVVGAIQQSFSFDRVNTSTSLLGTIAIQKDPAVAGVGFTLFASNGTTVVRAEQLTDAAGKVAFRNLPFGTYIIRETTGIPGFAIAPDQTVTITSANVTRIIGLIFVNTPTTTTTTTITVAGITEGIQVLGFTGVDPIIPIAGGSALVIGLALILLSIMRRKRNWKHTYGTDK